MASDQPLSPHFVAAYPALPARAVGPATEEMLTRSPPSPVRSWSRNTSVAVIAPSRFTSTIWRISSRQSVVKGPSSITPALFTSTSAPPSSSLTRAAATVSESRSVTSADRASEPLPSSAARASMRSNRRASRASR